MDFQKNIFLLRAFVALLASIILLISCLVLRDSVNRLQKRLEPKQGEGWFKCYCLDEHRDLIQQYANTLKKQVEND